MLQATKNQISNAEQIMGEIMMPTPYPANVALAIITAGILIATQLNQIASSIDCDKIASAIESS